MRSLLMGAGLAAAAGCGAPVAGNSSVQASQPTNTPRQAPVETAAPSAVSSLLIQCLVNAPEGDSAAARAVFCDRVEALAREGAPVPVSTLASGSAAPAQAGVLTLFAHATVHQDDRGAGSLVAFNIRPFRAGVEQAVAQDAQQRLVRLPAGSAGSTEFDAALQAALDLALPWRATHPQRLY